MASSTWTNVQGTNLPSGSFNNMLLLTDASVLIQIGNTVNWYRLTPDPSSGTYENGSWAGPFNMAIPRLWYASGVLQDGRVFVLGGEVNGTSGQGGFMTAGEIFDPATNLWSPLAKPSNFDYINGDATSCVLADGRVIFGATGTTFVNNNTVVLPSGSGNRTAIWDPRAETWFEAGLGFASTQTKKGDCDEETWTLLPDGTVLAMDAYTSSLAEIYNPITDTWQQINPGPSPSLGQISIPNPAPNSSQASNSPDEIGPALVLPNGTVFALGGNGETGVYTLPTTSAPTATWKPGPHLPTASTTYNNTGTTNYQTVLDGPACLLPSGQVLFIAGDTIYNDPNNQQQLPPGYWSQSNFYIYDSTQVDITKQINPLDTPPNINSPYTYEMAFLLLPTGQVLCSTYTNTLQVLTPGSQYGAPPDSWRPVPTNIPTEMVTGHTYTISGYLLNGLSQGSSYGDDLQNATNYPIVQITSPSTPSNTRYLRTFDFSTRGISRVGDTTPQSFSVQVPDDIPAGTWELKVIANGIGSSPTSIQILRT